MIVTGNVTWIVTMKLKPLLITYPLTLSRCDRQKESFFAGDFSKFYEK